MGRLMKEKWRSFQGRRSSIFRLPCRLYYDEVKKKTKILAFYFNKIISIIISKIISIIITYTSCGSYEMGGGVILYGHVVRMNKWTTRVSHRESSTVASQWENGRDLLEKIKNGIDHRDTFRMTIRRSNDDKRLSS